MSEEKLLQPFFYNPMHLFGIRELSRETGLDTKTVMKYLKRLVNDNIILKKKNKGHFTCYEANRGSETYRIFKSTILIERIARSGIIDFLREKLNPRAIVLFGSVQKGTYIERSDIDFFIQGKDKNIDVSFYEKKLGHEIQLLFEEDMGSLTEGLRNNIINGYTLSGRLSI